VTAHLFIRLLAEKTPEEMALISEYPALLRVMNFGKYHGQAMTFEQCAADDPKYLRWIRDESSMNEDTKFSARYWLQKRGA
jgi:exodeoxyribonuclease X